MSEEIYQMLALAVSIGCASKDPATFLLADERESMSSSAKGYKEQAL